MEKKEYSLQLKNEKSLTCYDLESLYLNYLDVTDDDDISKITAIGKALSVPIRVKIIKELNKRPMTLSETAKLLDLQVSSIAFHMQTLLEAGLICVCESPQKKGHLKWHSYAVEKAILIKLRDFIGEAKENDSKSKILDIGVGEYFDLKLDCNTSGMASEEMLISDKNQEMFCKDRFKAQILWTTHGYVSYPINNEFLGESDIESIEISLEICSEARGYNNNFPSDITFMLNDTELCTYTCPGDYGDRYGKYTPSWWYLESTKYGLLTIITIRSDGVYLNGAKVNKNVTTNNLTLKEGMYSLFTIKVKDDAIHKGGFNLFGEKFGDYNQAIRITINKK